MMAPIEYHVRIQPRAAKDVVNICRYIEPDSPQNATLVADRLLDAIESLAILPYRYKVHRSSKRRDRVIRSMPVPPFIVYYRIRERVQAIDVISVKHGA